jgi:hypothetical protein
VSPIPPVPSSSTAPSSSVSSPSELGVDDQEDNEAWQDDDEYYATHASGFITLAPPLPPSFPCSSALPATPAASTARAMRRESAIIPASTAAPLRPSQQLDPTYASHRASVRLSRAISIPTRAPPPPPIITSGSHSRSGSSSSTNAVKPAPPSRPPPRTPVPMDALSDDYAADYAAYAPLLASRTPSRTSLPLFSPSFLLTIHSSFLQLQLQLASCGASLPSCASFPCRDAGRPIRCRYRRRRWGVGRVCI